MLHYSPRHVSSINMPIFRRTNCFITTSGIVTLCKRLYSIPDESRLQSSFDVFLTVHHSIDLFRLPTLMHNSFIHQQYVCYITILDMFRASTCPSSRGKIVLSQHLVSSLSVNRCTVGRMRADGVITVNHAPNNIVERGVKQL